MLIEFFKIIDWMKSKANQILETRKSNPKCDVHTLPKNLIVEILYM
jgi:hypothetical protein